MMFKSIQNNEWKEVYCKYGITAEVEDPSGEYNFGRTDLFNKRQNDFLHELHVRQDIVRVNVDRVHRKMKNRSPELFKVHTIEQEDKGRQFCNVLLEIKLKETYDYILILCEKTDSGWRINNGPLLNFNGEILNEYIKNLKR